MFCSTCGFFPSVNMCGTQSDRSDHFSLWFIRIRFRSQFPVNVIANGLPQGLHCHHSWVLRWLSGSHCNVLCHVYHEMVTTLQHNQCHHHKICTFFCCTTQNNAYWSLLVASRQPLELLAGVDCSWTAFEHFLCCFFDTILPFICMHSPKWLMMLFNSKIYHEIVCLNMRGTGQTAFP